MNEKFFAAVVLAVWFGLAFGVDRIIYKYEVEMITTK